MRKDNKGDVEVTAISDGKRVHVGYSGNTIPVRTENFEGSIFFAARPPEGSKANWAYSERTKKHGWLMEVQLHGRFLKKPQGEVYLLGELREGPMQLGLVSRALCRAILKFAKIMARDRGGDFFYAFGEEAGQLPSIGVPALLLDRIFVADRSHPLPVGNADDTQGTWRLVDGKWEPIERSSVTFDTESWVTIVLASGYVDWTNWQLANMPGIGTLTLETFWGNQAAWISIADFRKPDGSDTHYFLQVNLEQVKASPEGKAPAAELEEYPPQDYSRVEVEVEVAAIEDQQGRSSDEENFDDVEEWERRRTPYDDEEEDLSPAVPQERDSLIPDSAISSLAGDLSPGTGADIARVEQIELQLESADVGQLRTRIESLEDDEDSDEVQLDAPTTPQKVNGSTTDPTLSLAPMSPLSPKSLGSRGRTRLRSLCLPWYLRTSGGQIWWCISVQGHPLCWRSDHQLKELCKVVPDESELLCPGSGVQDMEMVRRRATRLLAQLDTALLDEFIRLNVDLKSLLGSSRAGWVGLVDCEGRIVERKLHAGEVLRWRTETGFLSFMERGVAMPSVAMPSGFPSPEIVVDIAGAAIGRLNLADAPAMTVTTSQRQFLFIFRSDDERSDWEKSLRTTGTASPQTPWKDPLRRWPVNRVVANDSLICLEPVEDALALSADLLRTAAGAQTEKADGHLQHLNSMSSKLKGVDLSSLDPQDLWGFWVNIYHTLLIHSCVQFGRPRSLRSLPGFYNNCSYVVAGHIFSLAEMEHCVLRCNMRKPSARLLKLLVRVWRRSDKELEDRPSLRAPVSPANVFQARPDWRLSLILSAGNLAGSDRIPVFERMSEKDFDRLLNQSMRHMLRITGRMDRKPVQLPYVLYRFRDDAPGTGDGYERRWATALAPLLEGTSFDGRVGYRTSYKWAMRERLELLERGT
mmetsp:Transcript_16351/g.28670  ORF Transcript_16351/g.28670 Transcript_16351/m.28670 type:complete len:923 (-) Transcript_16351:32-2800(-)